MKGCTIMPKNKIPFGTKCKSSPRLILPLNPMQIERAKSTKSCERNLTIDNMNPNIIEMEYAVRGEVPARSSEIEDELKAGKKKPFKEVIKANLGDCHAMGQLPITFLRQVVTAITYPELIKTNIFPKDVNERAKIILSYCKGGSVGAYTESAGVEIIRRHCAEYIEKRDRYPSNWQDILLSSGATEGIKNIMRLFSKQIEGKKGGVMIPIPQYPLYSACLTTLNLRSIGYYLNEENKWSLEIPELERALNEGRKECYPRAIVVINPGNPTGQVLSKKNIQDIIKFACNENLFIIADEVYQNNIYDPNAKFYSMKKVMCEMGPPYSNKELASFMSASKGVFGECGLRGGYCELMNIDPKVKAMLIKMISSSLCSSVLGQAAIDCVVKPPKPGDESYKKFTEEVTNTFKSLNERAILIADTFNSFEGFKCQRVQGALYAFPQVQLPKKAIEKAKSLGKSPDVFYSLQLLEETGVCVVPGTGFYQKPGTHHFRTTICPQTDKLKQMLQIFKEFHEKFVQKYK